MRLRQRSRGQIALLVLALLGAADGIYLTLVHYNDKTPLICSTSGIIDCQRVLSSVYSLVPSTSIPISVPGLGWCLVAAALAGIGLYLGVLPPWLRVAEFVWTLLGLFTVLYLVYVEIVRLHTLCLWCTVLHAFILIMFLITFVQLQPSSSDLNEEPVAGDAEVMGRGSPARRR